MSEKHQNVVTRLLNQLSEGQQADSAEVMPVVYDELRRIAATYMRGERAYHTLQTTDLVNEAYLKLVGLENINYSNRMHFFAIAATAMRRILIDYARKKKAAKHGGSRQKLDLDQVANLSEEKSDELLRLNDTLEALAELDERQSQIVELRYFAGLNIEETAKVLGISRATVKREWRMARAWIYNEMKQKRL